MTPITHLRQAESLAHLDHTLALELVQALHRHLAPSALLEVLWQQVERLTPASGMRYRHAPLEFDITIGDGLHSASYTLSHHGESLGELELRFRRRPDEGALQSAEDLLALAIPA